jgi:hypothetical protein
MSTDSQKPDKKWQNAPDARRRMVALRLFEKGGVTSASKIAEEFGVSRETAQKDLRHHDTMDHLVEFIREHAYTKGVARAWEVIFHSLNAKADSIKLRAAMFIIDKVGVFGGEDEGDGTDFDKLMDIINGNGAMDGAYSEN